MLAVMSPRQPAGLALGSSLVEVFPVATRTCDILAPLGILAARVLAIIIIDNVSKTCRLRLPSLAGPWSVHSSAALKQGHQMPDLLSATMQWADVFFS